MSDKDESATTKVLLLNDEETTMEFVVHVLEDIFGKTHEEALKLVLDIDANGSMNLPLELQRRLDRRWSARFGMSDQGSRPDRCAAMVGAESRHLEKGKSPPPSTAMIDPLSIKIRPKLNARWSRLRHLP
jgi:ATP-dependent Clp protease adaptor protein ClpS